MSIDLCDISGDVQYWHNMDQGVALRCLCGNELVYSCFDAVNVFCGGSSCEPTEGCLQEKAVNFSCIVHMSVVGWNSAIV